MNCKQIAKHFGVQDMAIRYHLKKAELVQIYSKRGKPPVEKKITSPAKCTTAGSTNLTDIQIAEIKQLASSPRNLKIYQLAIRFKSSPGIIEAILSSNSSTI